MSYDFYSDLDYRERQSRITKENWKLGIYDFEIVPLETRTCASLDCANEFKAKPGNLKKFCSRSCAVHTNNIGRVVSDATKKRISIAMKSLPRSFFQKGNRNRFKERIKLICLACGKTFERVPYLARKQKYCSVLCTIKTIGARTTSHKASKGKSGIRVDIDPNICFYSTWEANVARVFNLIGLKWVYAPKLFDLGEHTYRPDFYLPDFDMFIEIKNFMGEYSQTRHLLFRKKFPKTKLKLILKKDYLQIKDNYKYFIENWEY